MQTRSLVCGSLAAVTIAGLLVACDNPETRNPLTPSAPRMTGVELLGPDTLAPGQTAQYTVAVRFADGSRKVGVPGTNMHWSSDAQFIHVDAGLATAQQRLGDTSLRVVVQGQPISSTKEITIVPAGTFRVVGQVVDADSPSTPVHLARVEATPGSLVTTTDTNGRYRLYGVPADATIRATREGYNAVEHRLELTGHVTQDFRLPASGDRLMLSGNYTLELEVGSACSGAFSLPSALRSRRYDAVLTQNGNQVEVVLTGPRFKLNSSGHGRQFTGQVTGSRANFSFWGYSPYYYPFYGYPSVVEELADGSVLIPSGSVVATGSSANVSGVMSNFSSIEQWSAAFPFGQWLSSCSHQSPIVFTLTRR